MKITEDFKELAKRFGNRMDGGELSKELWNIADCLSMIESHLAYNDYDFMNSRHNKRYVDVLGYDKVNEIWTMAKKYFDENCYVKHAAYTDTDNEGLTYNCVIDRNEN